MVRHRVQAEIEAGAVPAHGDAVGLAHRLRHRGAGRLVHRGLPHRAPPPVEQALVREPEPDQGHPPRAALLDAARRPVRRGRGRADAAADAGQHRLRQHLRGRLPPEHREELEDAAHVRAGPLRPGLAQLREAHAVQLRLPRELRHGAVPGGEGPGRPRGLLRGRRGRLLPGPAGAAVADGDGAVRLDGRRAGRAARQLLAQRRRGPGAGEGRVPLLAAGQGAEPVPAADVAPAGRPGSRRARAQHADRGRQP
mmetsp:Transcript_7038/g.18028  ORF Transcript_7038/g.18028 Transcript_7038/m.18028 type:complete len:253 (+) Transcript_7038:398-1156(+)